MTRRLEELDPSLADVLPAVLWLFDAPTGEEDWDTLDPLIKRRKTMEAVTQLILRVSRDRPLLLILEDLQWFDLQTQSVLNVLANAGAAQRQSCCF